MRVFWGDQQIEHNLHMAMMKIKDLIRATVDKETRETKVLMHFKGKELDLVDKYRKKLFVEFYRLI